MSKSRLSMELSAYSSDFIPYSCITPIFQGQTGLRSRMNSGFHSEISTRELGSKRVKLQDSFHRHFVITLST